MKIFFMHLTTCPGYVEGQNFSVNTPAHIELAEGSTATNHIKNYTNDLANAGSFLFINTTYNLYK